MSQPIGQGDDLQGPTGSAACDVQLGGRAINLQSILANAGSVWGSQQALNFLLPARHLASGLEACRRTNSLQSSCSTHSQNCMKRANC